MRVFIISIIFFIFSSFIYSSEIKDIRYSSAQDRTRIVIDLDSYPFYRVEDHPPNLHIYLPGYKGNSKIITPKDGLVREIKIESNPISTSLSIELAKVDYDYHVFPLTKPYRLVIDLFRGKSMTTLKRIVIDPGHGGRDPGAIGWQGIKEKNMTIKIAFYLKDYLEKNGFRVFLTRQKDVFVPLRKRVEFSNSHKADLFISIHCNSSISRKAKGFETYYLSETFDPLSKAVARVENSVLNLESETEKQKLTILEDLDFIEYRKESILLAKFIQEKLSKYLATPNRGYKPAIFYVLKGINSPGVLVETGFISNPYEARMFRKSYYLKEIAHGIGEGILFFKEEFKRSAGFTHKLPYRDF